MAVTARSTLGRVLDDLGETLLETLAGTVDHARPVSGVLIHDPLDPVPLGPDSLVLGVGLRSVDDISALLREPGTTAVVVRVPVPVTAELQAAAKESGSVLLGLTRGAPGTRPTAR